MTIRLTCRRAWRTRRLGGSSEESAGVAWCSRFGAPALIACSNLVGTLMFYATPRGMLPASPTVFDMMFCNSLASRPSNSSNTGAEAVKVCTSLLRCRTRWPLLERRASVMISPGSTVGDSPAAAALDGGHESRASFSCICRVVEPPFYHSLFISAVPTVSIRFSAYTHTWRLMRTDPPDNTLPE